MAVPQRRQQKAREVQPRNPEPDLFAAPDALPGETPAFDSIVADSSRDLVPGGSPRSAVTVSTLTQTRNEGRAEGRADLLLRQLARRFGAEAAKTVEQRIHTASIAELDRFAERVLDARTIDAVFAPDPE